MKQKMQQSSSLCEVYPSHVLDHDKHVKQELILSFGNWLDGFGLQLLLSFSHIHTRSQFGTQELLNS